MTDPRSLYGPWHVKYTYFSRMLFCGAEANGWLEHALTCLPIKLFSEWKERLAFLSTTGRDAFRVGRALRENRELVVISERIIPKPGMSEANPVVRYFIFAVLHEVAHAIRQHKPPNEISEGENKAQEAEADRLAFGWYNGCLRRREHPDLLPFTEEELRLAQAKSREAMQAR